MQERERRMEFVPDRSEARAVSAVASKSGKDYSRQFFDFAMSRCLNLPKSSTKAMTSAVPEGPEGFCMYISIYIYICVHRIHTDR